MLDLCNVVFEDCGYVALEYMSVHPEDYGMASLLQSACTHLWEHALAVADQETSLATSTITDHHEFLAVLRRRRDVCARAAGGSGVYGAI